MPAIATSRPPAMSQANDEIRVLIIDDDRNHAHAVSDALDGHYDCTIASGGVEGVGLLESDEWDVILLDLKMADMDGLTVLKKSREVAPDAEVVMITGFGDVKTAVEAIKQGAANYLTKPVDLDELRAIVKKASERRLLTRTNRELMKQLDERFGFAGVIGNSPAMQELVKRLRQIASTDATVLLLGETGTGKDLIAGAIHNNSIRKNKHFATLNCAAPNENLIEDELFGHEKGAYTSGERMRKGIFEYASGGTVFLDEIGDMAFKLQAKLLRVLENRVITRIGSNDPIKVDIRLIAATHQDLEAKIASKEFRMDLYQRLKVVTIRIPALRERREDIPLLAAHFMKLANEAHKKNCTAIAEPVRRLMAAYHWEGNVRELRNFIESMVIYDTDGVLGMDDIPIDSDVLKKTGATPTASVSSGGADNLVGRPLKDVERYYMEQALRLADNNREEAARMLNVGERTLYRKIQDWKEEDRIRAALGETGGEVAAAAAKLELTEAKLREKMKHHEIEA